MHISSEILVFFLLFSSLSSSTILPSFVYDRLTKNFGGGHSLNVLVSNSKISLIFQVSAPEQTGLCAILSET